MIGNRHAGRTVVVTGAASGIGRGIAVRFAEEGADVVVADVRRDPKQGRHYDTDVSTPTDELVEEHGVEGRYVETDVTDPEQVAALVETTVETFGGLDVYVNNAGIFIPGDSQELGVEEWQETLAVDLDGTFYGAKYAVPHLKDAEGALINVSSVNASEGGIGPAYSSAKAAIVNLTRDLAVELGEHRVNVNAICPGFVETPIQAYQSEEEIERSLEHVLIPRAGVPEDIGDAAVFLASDEAAYVHGEALYVDGGWAAHRA